MARASGSDGRGHRRRGRGRRVRIPAAGGKRAKVSREMRTTERGNEEGANRRGRFRLRPQPRDRLVRREHRHPRSHANARGGDDGHLQTKVRQAQEHEWERKVQKYKPPGSKDGRNVQRAARKRRPGIQETFYRHEPEARRARRSSATKPACDDDGGGGGGRPLRPLRSSPRRRRRHASRDRCFAIATRTAIAEASIDSPPLLATVLTVSARTKPPSVANARAATGRHRTSVDGELHPAFVSFVWGSLACI